MNRLSDLSTQYTRDVRRKRLLTREEEFLLARRIKYSHNPEVKLRARNILVERNLRFVLSIVNEYVPRIQRNVESEFIDDLVNEGNKGLITAADRFDESRGYRFISYAVWWVRQCITKYIADHSRTVRLPINKGIAVQDINIISDKHLRSTGKPITDEELKEHHGITDDDLLASRQRIHSLDNHFDDDEVNYHELLPDPENPTQIHTQTLEQSLYMNKLLRILTPQEANLITNHYGLQDAKPLSLEELASNTKVSVEELSRTHHRALEKMRSYEQQSAQSTPPSSLPPRTPRSSVIIRAHPQHTPIDEETLSAKSNVIAQYAQQLITYSQQPPTTTEPQGFAHLIEQVTGKSSKSVPASLKASIYEAVSELEGPLHHVALSVYGLGSKLLPRLEFCVKEHTPLHNLFVQEQELLSTIATQLDLPIPELDFDHYVRTSASIPQAPKHVQEYLDSFYPE